MKRAMTGWLAAVAAGGTLWAADPPLQALSTNKPARVESEDLYRALRLNLYSITNDLSVERFGHPFVFSENDRCNFTYVSPSAADVTCSPDGLRFRATSEETVIGWGNYDNRQPRAERVPMFPGWNSVELEVSQSATGSTWQFTLWMDGVPKLDRNRRAELGSLSLSQALGGTFEARVKGTERQTIRFRAYRGQPDGFGLRITGPAGNEVTIHGLRVKKVRQNGYFRHRVTLPPGRAIWRAVGEVSGVRLFVNGREADFMPQLLKTQGDARTYPVDLAPLLKPGAVNTLAIDPAGSSFVYLQGRAVLDDGTVIGLDTGPDWKGALEPADGWIEPGFEDADWLPVATAPAKQPGNHHLNARWPVHDGRLLLENPGPDPKLYYDDSAPIRVQARIPGGWAGPRPELRWTLRRVERDTTRPTVGRGIVKPDTAQAVEDFRSRKNLCKIVIHP